MLYELISPEDYDNLPDDPYRQFIEIERICRKNMNELLNSDFNGPSADLAYNVRLQYMTTVDAAASELNILGVQLPDEINNMDYTFERFTFAASSAVTRLRLKGRKSRRADSVQLSVRTRGKIELRIRSLREAIEKGDMSDKKRKALLERLDALMAEINSPSRVSFANVMSALVFVAAATSGVADAPTAIANITEWIGIDKEAEDAEAERLTAPPNIMPDFQLKSPPERLRLASPAVSPHDDSDIPF